MSPSTTEPPSNPIIYGNAYEAWKGFEAYLVSLLDEKRPTRVCELGAGASPFFPLAMATERGFRYTLLDISAEELAKSPPGYDRRICDIAAPDLNLAPEYDFAFSRMLCEHVPNGAE